MEEENYLCNEVLNNLKWGSTALLEDVEQDSIVAKERQQSNEGRNYESPDQTQICMGRQEWLSLR